MGEDVEAIRQKYPAAQIEVWAEDEARIGLIPIMRRAWSLKGERPVAMGKRKYEWMYVYGFVRPATGATSFYLMPSVNVEQFGTVLQEFAKEHGVGEKKRIVLWMDQAGWHTSKKLQVPEGIHLLHQPAKSPEVQPSEKLWPLINEAVANEAITSKDQLEHRLVRRCCYLIAHPEEILGPTLFSWWAPFDLVLPGH